MKIAFSTLLRIQKIGEKNNRMMFNMFVHYKNENYDKLLNS